MTHNDNILTEPQMHRVYDVARAVNVVNVKVEALRRQVEQHVAVEDGADPVEGEQAADGEEPQPEMSPVFAGQLHDLAQLRALTAENAALRAKVNAHEKEMIDYIEASAAMYQRRTADLRAERDAAQARELEAEVAALRERLVPFPATETCQECGSALGIGFHIPDDVWAKISPTGDKWGVLCPWCADKRLKALGLTDVPAVFYPAFDVLRDEPGEWERRARQAEERVRELEAQVPVFVNRPAKAIDGFVFVQAEDVWFAMEAGLAASRGLEAITCSRCDKPAVQLDHQFPYDDRDNLCVEHVQVQREERRKQAEQGAADRALGALVRRMQRRVIVERLRDGTYSVGLRGEPRVYFRDEERTFAWAADAALDKEATDAH